MIFLKKLNTLYLLQHKSLSEESNHYLIIIKKTPSKILRKHLCLKPELRFAQLQILFAATQMLAILNTSDIGSRVEVGHSSVSYLTEKYSSS